MGFKMEVSGFGLEIDLEDLQGVHIHEETISSQVEKLERDIRSSDKVRDPVIVDSDTRVVLDGMHRVAALRKIGCRYLPVCSVDYLNPKVMLKCWNRIIRGNTWTPKFLDDFRSLGLDIENSTLDEAIKVLDRRVITAAILTPMNCHLIKTHGGDTDIKEKFNWVKRLEQIMAREGFSIGYETESDTAIQVRSGKASAALLVPTANKEEVVKAALSGNPFAHKTTRHVLPVRPMNVGVPLEWIQGNMSLDEADRALVKYLSKRKFEQLPGGSIPDGRRYEEELVVFR